MFDNIYSLRHVEQNLLSEICRRWDRFKLFDIIYTQIYRRWNDKMLYLLSEVCRKWDGIRCLTIFTL